MPVNINYYVNITAGVGAAETIPARQLIPMFFDDNALIPSGSFINFPNNNDAAANVGAYFGTSSPEYKRALFAFTWVSKSIRQVPSMSFARWNTVACAPQIFGASNATNKSVTTWNSVTSGAFSLTMGTHTFVMTGLDFSGASTLANVATIVQTAIQAETGGSTLWTGATVTYNSTAGRFELLGGVTGAAVIADAAGVSNDIAGQLGWLSAQTIFAPGADIQTLTACLNEVTAQNNNFGSFGFIATLVASQILEVATVNAGFNNLFMYSIPAISSTVTAIQAAVSGIGGCTVTLTSDGDSTQYEEMDPMLVMGATDYTAVNGTQNYMFQQFPGQVPVVTTDAAAATYDALKVNYYANTQQSGQLVNLYQRGVMNGGSTSPPDQNTYANECWLKGAMQSALMTLLLDLNKISANLRGQSQVLAIVQSIIQQAVSNGTISVGRTLTPTEKLFITNATGDQNAWQQVQNLGYVVTTNITTVVITGITNYIINYVLIYASDVVVRKITGADIQI